MASDYGLTWWGNQWLNSLSHIDYSNRLPRGRSYARMGYVSTIDIGKNKINAKVRGSRPKPYRVEITIPLFSEGERAKLMTAINADPLLLSKLLNRELPSELNKIAKDNNISVFPSSWKDFKMECSCPDWAVPCKHLASVIYILSSEIDKNPFLIFGLKGLEIIEELEKTGLKGNRELQVPEIKNLFISKNEADKNIGPVEPLSFDLSSIPPLTEILLSLLDEKPLFYSRAFIPVLRKNYKLAARMVKAILEKENEEIPAGIVEKYTTVEVILHNDAFYFDTLLISDEDEKHFSVNKGGIEKLSEYINSIPVKYFNRLSPALLSLCRAYQLSLKLIETGGIVPQLFRLSNNSNIIRWIAATSNAEIKDLMQIIENMMPTRMIQVMETSAKPKYLTNKEQANTLVSLFLNYFIQSSATLPYRTVSLEDKIDLLFFSGEPQEFIDLGETEVPGSIYQWLSRFFLTTRDYVPVIKVEDDEKENSFSIEVFVENRKNVLLELIELKQFIKDNTYAEAKQGVLQSLASLTKDFPDIAALISSSGVGELYYNSREFTGVLLRILPVIKLLGIRVLLPNSLKNLARPQTSLILRSNPHNEGNISFLTLDEMLSFQWRIAIGDQTVAVDEFKKLVKGLSGVVNIKGQYVLIDQAEIQHLLNNLDEEKMLSNSEILQSALTEEYQKAKISISDEARKIIQNLLKAEKKELPADLNATLRPYQERGYQWMYNNTRVGFGSIIADDMGLGKTVQVITLLLQLKQENQLKKQKALVVVPTTLITNWQKEIMRFAPGLSMHIYHGSSRQFVVDDRDMIITSYGVLRSDITLFQKYKWAVVVIDEAQNIKNAGTEQTKSVKKLKANVKIAMSGTPVENRLSEYWSIFDFVNKGYLGSLKYFKQEFSLPIERENNEKQLHAFKVITSPFILRRLKTDKKIISDLPDKIENNRFVKLTPEQTAIYQNIVDSMMKDVLAAKDDNIKRAGLIFKLMTALKQVCNHPSQFLKKEDYSPELSGKAVMLLNLLNEIYESGEKVLIFTQYKEMGEIMVKMIEAQTGNSPLFLHGSVSRKKRDQMVEDFQTKRHIKTFVLSIKAGGTGLNLTEANNVIHYDLWWNPAVEAQATDRAFRIGQQKNVMVYRMITQGTFEEKINEMLQKKKFLADLTVTAGEKWVGDLSGEEISELIRL